MKAEQNGVQKVFEHLFPKMISGLPGSTWFPAAFPNQESIYTHLPETSSSHLKIEGWKTKFFPFGAIGPIFQGQTCLLLVAGSVYIYIYICLPMLIPKN